MQRRVVKLRQPDSMSGGRGMMALEREMMSSGFTNNFGACHECSTLSSHIVLILRANDKYNHISLSSIILLPL